ncbi:MAG TPA: carbonic anhydrase family protein [Zoogloea sp.]|uniref:carbonic anhydrase n=1 Tax=Zoogloea sp. TaxID=49181 RepID=UPI002D0F637F|nr:surface-adhesin E family protein [Zoogloea sp.]HMV18853.1 carbonic anhydrase family protein [Rhodocyclaceae bacterium]HMW53214.1 carbonic anhydrase family protein [Rhodocyclaceae bacterium]HNF63225.1 carbonic anhydrase family protein [Rhodocyclaceae bacterium]HNI47878.1 carbonic anhydrase family protein [Zoogloea sp.]
MRLRMRPLVVLLALAGASQALAADWQTVAADKKRKIELDRASILQSDPGTKVAWGRIVLAEAEAEAAGYATVKALNRYDCRNQTFATIKRVYLDGDAAVLKDEKVKVEKDMPITAGSVDEKLWKEVCQPGGTKGLNQVAQEASKAAQAAAAKPDLRAADYRPAKGAEKPAVRQVNEGKGEEPPATPIKKNFIDKPAPPPKAEVAEKPAEKTAEKAPAPRVEAAPPEVRRVPAYVPPRPRVVRMPAVAVEAGAGHGPDAAGTPLAHHEIHWSYDGDGGPPNWGVLKPEWGLCSTGERQSPIDIREGIKVELEPIRFDYKPSYFRVVDNGHTIQVNLGPGNTLSVMGRQYDLVQFHFHRPSEERINGKGFDMVAHLVHKDLDGRLAVVAVLLERGSAHPLIQTLWNNLPLEKNVEYGPEGVSIDLNQLLPDNRSYYTYMGSLTTPPCSEGVLWMVLKQPAQMSADQIGIFSRLYPMNARPVQSIKGRLIKESR